MDHRPVILTLQIDVKSAAFFEAQRQKHFPADINFVPAHLTLFHQLPGEEFQRVLETVAKACAASAPFTMKAAAPMKLGRGVAYRIESEALERFRADLANAFAPMLTGQDKQGFRPHVTVQNKVSPQEAAALFDHLAEEFEPFDITAEGVQLWRYEGAGAKAGRWSPAGAIPFSAG